MAENETLRMLYPIFKQEVFNRRESIMKITTFGSVTLLVILLLVSSRLLSFGNLRWLAVLGLVFFTAVLIHQIQQQKVRHRQAKQGLIEIEKALQLFEQNAYLSGKSVYPSDWQSLPAKDLDVALSISSVIGLAVLVVLALVIG